MYGNWIFTPKKTFWMIVSIISLVFLSLFSTKHHKQCITINVLWQLRKVDRWSTIWANSGSLGEATNQLKAEKTSDQIPLGVGQSKKTCWTVTLLGHLFYSYGKDEFGNVIKLENFTPRHAKSRQYRTWVISLIPRFPSKPCIHYFPF